MYIRAANFGWRLTSSCLRDQQLPSSAGCSLCTRCNRLPRRLLVTKFPFAPSSTGHCSTRANIEPWAAHPRTSPRPDTGRLSVAGDAAFVSAAVAAAHRHLPPSTRRPKNPAVRPPRLQSTSNRPSSPTLTRTTPSASTSRSRISPSSAATPASAPTPTSSASTASAAPTAP